MLILRLATEGDRYLGKEGKLFKSGSTICVWKTMELTTRQ
jgi:hypothetical protein